MKLFIVKVNGTLLKATHEDWNWEEAQKSLKKTYGDDAAIELVSIMSDEDRYSFFN